MDHKEHAKAGLKTIGVVMLVVAGCIALIMCTPLIVGAFVAVIPVVGAIVLVVGGVWLLGLAVNTNKLALNKMRDGIIRAVNEIKHRVKKEDKV